MKKTIKVLLSTIIISSIFFGCNPKTAEYERLRDQAFELLSQNRYSDAEKIWIKLMDKVKTDFKNNNDKKDEVLINLAFIYMCKKEYREAEKLYRRSVDLKKKDFLLGGDFALLVPLTRLGGTLEVQGKKDEAESYYERALEICQKIGTEGTYTFYVREMESIKRHFEYNKEKDVVLSLEKRIDDIKMNYIKTDVGR